MKVDWVIGYDERERVAWNVCVRSLLHHSAIPYPIRPISIQHLGPKYNRPTERRDGRLWDGISGAFCATEFSIARFWSAWDALGEWTIFMDGDFLIRHSTDDLISQLDSRYALMCVKHDHKPSENIKMDNQIQTAYERKNWSSLMAFNNRHEGTRRLLRSGDLQLKPGLYLHQMKWLAEHEIGSLTADWNVLDDGENPKGLHLTSGTPDMPGYENNRFAKEWWSYA